MQAPFAFIEGLGSPLHWIVLLVIGVLLFGKRLPEVGRSLGKGIVEFKKGLKGLEDEVEGGASSYAEPRQQLEAPRPPQKVTTTAPKFEDAPGPAAPPQV
jgi:sec-independent protein translocase protein TatA